MGRLKKMKGLPRSRISKEKIGSFNPFRMKGFKCPVCGSKRFVELHPYGGVWCSKCNAGFEVSGTSDGPRKLAVRCITDHVHSQYRKKGLPKGYGTVIWQGDDKISWLELGRR